MSPEASGPRSLRTVFIGIFAGLMILSALPILTTRVSANSPPTISRVSPSTPVLVIAGESSKFTVQASDPDCDLRGAEWYLDGVFQGATYTFSSPYCSGATSRVFTFNSIGTYLVEVKSFDYPSQSYSPAINWTVRVSRSATIWPMFHHDLSHSS